MSPVNPKVVIIGAGPAGIAAAARLLQKGYTNITILEAEDRIGGRIHTIEFGDNVVDLGGQWCHGEENNVVYDMANPLGLLQSSKYNFTISTQFVDSSGSMIPLELTQKIHTLLNKIAVDENDEMVKYEGSVGEFILERFTKLVQKDLPDTDPNLRSMLVDWYQKVEDSIEGADSWFDASAKGLTQYWECPGDPLLNWGLTGYKTVLDILMNKIPDPSERLFVEELTILKKEVSDIIWNNSSGSNVLVKTADGYKYPADFVIVTVSLGVLKDRIKTLFTPELPSYKQTAIKGLNIGTVNKLIFKFPYRWWPETSGGFSIVWKESEGIGDLQTEIGGSVESNIWLRDVFGFYSVDHQPNILLGWVVSTGGRKMETLPEIEVKDKLMMLLRFFVGKSYNIPEPDDFVRTTWYSNPHFRGSYSFRSMNTEKMNTTAADLARPLKNARNEEVVFFAGEATHDHYYSTVHGAIETGWREAERIDKLLKAEVRRSKVVIIGAGIAGLAAANKILTDGAAELIILEAQSTVGGRIQTLPYNNSFIEIGAQWIHGNNNALWELADQHNLISKQTSEEALGIYIRDDGYIFEKMLVAQVDIVVGNILHKCEEFFYGSDSQLPVSVGDFLIDEFEKYLKSCGDDDEELIRKKRELFNWHVQFQIIDNSCNDLKQLSAKTWGSYSCSSDHGQEHINCEQGYSTVVDVLCKRIPTSVLKLDHAVTEINWATNSRIRIQCANDRVFDANFVIVTASIGVLKQSHKELFQPNLPCAIQKTIENMGFGAINKVFIEFPFKWWDVDGFQLVWREGSSCPDSPWLKYVSGFDEVLQHPNMLLGWVGGPGAEMVEQIPEVELGVRCVQFLRKITGKDIPEPINVIRTKWLSNRFIRGGYSHLTKECDKENVGPRKLSGPILRSDDQPAIVFAGEACSSRHFSTTHGAFESGERQAKYILDFIHKADSLKETKH